MISPVAMKVAVVAALLSAAAVGACVDVGFYDTTCPTAETLIQQVVATAFRNDSGVAPAMIRMHFHDCFVRGCDGSVLIDSTPGSTAEKDAIPNNPSLRFFDVIDRAKAAVEAACPGVVSCADILAFMARDSVVLSGGLGYQVPAGRRDGRVSLEIDALNNLPGPTSNASELVSSFAGKNLTAEDMVVLSGAHTIGVSHCSSFVDRLYNKNTSDGIDPALSKAYAFLLKSICPRGSNQTFPTTTTLMDIITPTRFDNKYYVGLTNNLGLFESDAALLTNATLKAMVDSFVRSEATFRTKFARAMLKMGQIDLLSGTQGEIRRNCRVINPSSFSSSSSSSSGPFVQVAAS
ncbi:hypothetical protein GUJ93_ZPchr0005g15831 [Zizania palustris]|uniref:Peroxidase 1 n=1 Tax=Zizania palustris TaxID=103762 RepID=A0A8J5SM69_ZIZPA|nr:hypothetical protein GUJ93_ZPchr0005g15831 [Zizania palustris]